jgi:hypothetical protein
VTIVVGLKMAKQGRPPTGDGERGTKQVRLMEDLAEKCAYIVKVEGGTTAQLLDPMIRDEVEARYERHRPAIEKIKAAEEELRKVVEEANLSSQRKGRKPKTE